MKAATIGPAEHGYVAPQPKKKIQLGACARSPRFNTIEGFVPSMVHDRGQLKALAFNWRSIRSAMP